MPAAARQQLEACLDLFRRGELREEHLQAALASLDGKPKRQDLLYLQTRSTGPDSQVIGMMTVRDGRLDQGPADPKDWPYQNVLMAIADGWRAISFPNLALMSDDRETYGLGCEFILERWSD